MPTALAQYGRAELERLKDGGVQRIKDALAAALDTRDAAITRAEKAEAEIARMKLYFTGSPHQPPPADPA